MDLGCEGACRRLDVRMPLLTVYLSEAYVSLECIFQVHTDSVIIPVFG